MNKYKKEVPRKEKPNLQTKVIRMPVIMPEYNLTKLLLKTMNCLNTIN